MKRVDTDETLPAAPSDRPSGAATAAIPGYQLGALIGRGGMGEVVLGHDAKVGRDVAIKRLRDPEATEDDVSRFLREARIQALLDHPAIVPVHDVGTDATGRPYFTMKRVTGTTLAQVLARGSEKLHTLLRAFVDVCLAIDLAHTRRIVHRDLKPANIMLGDYGEVYILDWGLARILDDRLEVASADSVRERVAGVDSGMTQLGTVLGTPGYMAPEQLRGEPIGTAADIYALGAILFELLAGEPLHKEARSRDTVEDVPSPLHRNPARAIPPELDALCADALASAPEARPAARVLADRVQAYLDGDRDLARRRALAADQLEAARAALASDERSVAIHRAGRALALDPESPEAATLMTELLVKPPKVLPPDLVKSLDEAEQAFLRTRARRSVGAYLAVFVLVLYLPFAHVVSWPVVIGQLVLIAALAGSQWINSRSSKEVVPWPPLMIGNLLVVLSFSRVNGVLMITPLIICAIQLAMGSREKFAMRPWAVAAFGVTAMLVPITLEQLGVLAPTFGITDAGIVSTGTAMLQQTSLDLVVWVGGTVLVVGLLGIYAAVIMRSRSDAHRALLVQAWQLEQLLPKQRAAA